MRCAILLLLGSLRLCYRLLVSLTSALQLSGYHLLLTLQISRKLLLLLLLLLLLPPLTVEVFQLLLVLLLRRRNWETRLTVRRRIAWRIVASHVSLATGGTRHDWRALLEGRLRWMGL